MPPDYTADSSYHVKRRWTNPHTVKCLETACRVLGTPASLVDFGCAEGVTVNWAREQGVDAIGVDLAVPENNPALWKLDLRDRVELGRQFQWVLNWEVAEHLEAEHAERLCHTLVRHMQPSGRLLFTAARPGQPGPGHVNCQPPEYWQEKLFDLGLVYAEEPSAKLRAAWRKSVAAAPWYWRNLMVFWRVG